MHKGGGGGGGGAKRTPESISARLGQQIGVCTKKFSAMEPLSISWALALGMGVAPVVIGNASPSIWAWSSVRKNTMFGLLGLLSAFALAEAPLRAMHGGAESAHDFASASIVFAQHNLFHDSGSSSRDSQPESTAPQ